MEIKEIVTAVYHSVQGTKMGVWAYTTNKYESLGSTEMAYTNLDAFV